MTEPTRREQALLLQPIGGPAEVWRDTFHRLLPALEVRIWPELGDPAGIAYAAIAGLPHGTLANLPNLRLIASLLAGQDRLLSDPHLPHTPIIRTDDPEGDVYLVECVLLHVLRHHRRLPEYAHQQAGRTWARLPLRPARERRVGLLGLGSIGGPAALALARYGFNVAGWTRTPRTLPGVATFTGPDALPALLARTEILVNLLPSTASTDGILDRRTLSLLPRGASLINLARGSHVIEPDLMALLDDAHLSAATLDVFAAEPLPPESPFWTHPRVTITPHAARELDAAAIATRIADALLRFENGTLAGPFVDRGAGY